MGRGDESQALKAELVALRSRLADLERRFGANDSVDAPLPAGEVELLVCRVGGERVAIPLREVREVVPIAATAVLPESPPWIVGLLQVGEAAVPTIDVLARFHRSHRAVELSDLVVLCRFEPSGIGLVVQEVIDVVRFDVATIVPPSRDVSHAPYLRGTFRDDAGAILVLGLVRFVELSGVSELESENRS